MIKKHSKSEPRKDPGTAVPSYTPELGTRIATMIQRVGGLKAAQKFTGVTDETLAAWRDGRSEPRFLGLQGLAAAAGLSMEWLASGLDSGQDIDISAANLHSKKEGPPLVHQGEIGPGFVLVPRYDVEASAGPGALNDEEHVVDYMAFREDWVRRTLRVDPQKLVLIAAIGDSMEPAIRAGDLLLVDTGVDRVIDDAIYVLLKRDELVVKRIQQFFNGAVTVKSDNSAYVEETLDPVEANDIRVAGRVRWIGRLI